MPSLVGGFILRLFYGEAWIRPRVVMEKSISKELEELLGAEFEALSGKNKERLCQLYEPQRRTAGMGYILWFLSLHYAYVRQWQLCTLFIVSFGGLVIWWLVDLFRIPTILRAYNKKTAKELLRILE